MLGREKKKLAFFARSSSARGMLIEFMFLFCADINLDVTLISDLDGENIDGENIEIESEFSASAVSKTIGEKSWKGDPISIERRPSQPNGEGDGAQLIGASTFRSC